MAKGQQLYRCKECNHQFFDNGKYPRMRKPRAAVDEAFEMYCDFSPLSRIARRLRKRLGVEVDRRNIHRWFEKYVPPVDDFLWYFVPHLSGVWHTDETVLNFTPSTPPSPWEKTHKIRRPSAEWWQWDVIDAGTRLIVGTRISKTRTYREGLAYMQACKDYAPRPHEIVSDNLPVTARIIRRLFYSNRSSEQVKHTHMDTGFRPNQLIERWHGTLKDRITPMRGLKSPNSPIPRLLVIEYNFLRPHDSLPDCTPAVAAGIELPFNDGWGNLITWAIVHHTLLEVERRKRRGRFPGQARSGIAS